MQTAELIGVLPRREPRGELPPEVTGVACDSRAVRPGDLFVCLEGLTADGHRFAAQAVSRGAALVVARRDPEPAVTAPLLLVPDTREALARLAAAFHGYPSRRLQLIGVTGTNGKTTITHFLTAIAEAAGRSTGRIGTVGYDYAGRHVDAPHTTPEATVLNGLLREMVDHGVTFCAMEVSSHALDQRRVFDLDFAAVLFTNLTRDHLDYHHDFETYYQAKRRLFRRLERGNDPAAGVERDPAAAGRDPVAVINADDPAGRRLAGESDRPVVTFGVETPADYRGVIERLDGDGTSLRIETPRGPIVTRLRMVGPFNVANAVGAAAATLELGIPAEAVAAGLAGLTGVPGRMERVDRGQPFLVLVDYAHTPDALQRVLEATRAATTGRLLVVFGCGGDRDRTKRPIMGRLATSIADRTFITSDNPRSEDPAAIVAEIEAGAREGGGAFQVILDRGTAIEEALRSAEPGDSVVVAGKGHEPYQILGERTIHFDDRETAAAILESLGAGGRHGR
jgi:UDP-N-acetylmuramoyl-L-alanyl-D-glutamate--2,6-diaminopimelate ligase